MSEAATPPPAAAPRGTSRRRRLPAFVRYLGLVAAAVLALLPLYYILYLALSKSGNEFDFPPHVWPEPIKVAEPVARVPRDGRLSREPLPLLREQHHVRGSRDPGLPDHPVDRRLRVRAVRFPGRNLLFGLTVAMLMMPFVVTLIRASCSSRTSISRTASGR